LSACTGADPVAVELDDRRLDEWDFQCTTPDVKVESTFKRRRYRGRRRTGRRTLRLLVVRAAGSTGHRFYLTDIPLSEMDGESLAQVYACRWQAELLFAEFKSHHRLDEFPTR